MKCRPPIVTSPRVWTDALAGRAVPSDPPRRGGARLAAPDLFADLPVALLYGGAAREPS